MKDSEKDKLSGNPGQMILTDEVQQMFAAYATSNKPAQEGQGRLVINPDAFKGDEDDDQK